MKLSPLMLAVITVLPVASYATTDWTPKLKPMLAGCEGMNLYELPKSYQSAIVKKIEQSDGDTEDDPYYMTYMLKDSVAFGQPISRIKLASYDSGYGTTIYFKNADFIKLRPLFKLPKVSASEAKSVKNTKLGYQAAMTNLTFNPKDKSITCSGYAS